MLGYNIFPGIPKTTDEKIVSVWLKIIKRGECGIIVFPPKGDAYRRIEHLLSWKKIRQKYLEKLDHEYILIAESMLPYGTANLDEILVHLLNRVMINKSNIISVESFISRIKKSLHSKSKVCFFLYDTDDWFRQGRSDIFTTLSTIAERCPNILFLLFCEINISSPHLLRVNFGKTTLAQNILIQPLYSLFDMEYFLESLMRFLQTDIPPVNRKLILAAIGCHTWLLKEATRLYSNGNNYPATYHHAPSMRLKLETIWQQLTLVERSVCQKLIEHQFNFTPLEKDSLIYLQQIGFVEEKTRMLTLTLPILTQYIKEKHASRILESKRKQLILDGIDVSRNFSPHEKRVITTLIENTGTVQNRDQLASAVWGTVDYSDWALDRILSRIRGKLRRLSVSLDHLITVKRVGFLWR